jgi:hypothetical protein
MRFRQEDVVQFQYLEEPYRRGARNENGSDSSVKLEPFLSTFTGPETSPGKPLEESRVVVIKEDPTSNVDNLLWSNRQTWPFFMGGRRRSAPPLEKTAPGG